MTAEPTLFDFLANGPTGHSASEPGQQPFGASAAADHSQPGSMRPAAPGWEPPHESDDAHAPWSGPAYLPAADGDIPLGPEPDEPDEPEDTAWQNPTFADHPDLQAPPIDVDPVAAVAAPAHVTRAPERLLTGLNVQQALAVNALSGPVLVVAGPGSGKTRVLTHRIAALLHGGVAPWQVLAVTFTNKAAAEMRERLEVLVGTDAARDMWIATFHSACVRVLRSAHAEAGLPRSFTIADSDDSKRILKQILGANGAQVDAADIKQAATVISTAKNAGKNAADLQYSANLEHRAFAEIMEQYDTRLAHLGAVDFDDLLLKTLRVFQQHPDVLRRYQRRWRHISIDEFQDTNGVQAELIRLLAPAALLTAEPDRSLLVVGDADQSIYAFRGATPAIIDNFNKDWPAAKVVVLDQNYRSTKAILQTVQAIIDPNPAVHRANLWTDNNDGEPVVLYVADDDRDEASWIVNQIRKRVLEQGTGLAEHAVLLRTNSQTRALEEELNSKGLVYDVVGALRFYDREEVKDTLAYLRVATNPRDEIALARCINTPKRGIGDTSVTTLLAAARATGADPISYLRAQVADGTATARLKAGLEAFLTCYDAVVRAAWTGPAAALRVVAEDSGLKEALLARKDGSGPDRVENVDQLISSALSYITRPGVTDSEGRAISALTGGQQTVAFLENVALVSSSELAEEEGQARSGVTGRVQLLTAHASKGKEWPHVYVAGTEQNLFPHSRSLEDEIAMQEERRLLFVAASRAQKTLALTRARRRMQFGRIVENAPSVFLADLPADVQTITSPRTSLSGAFGQRPGGFDRMGTGRSSAPTRAFAPRAPGAPLWKPGGVKPVKPVAGPRLSADEISIGATVEHTVYGIGTVRGLAGTSVTVAFNGVERQLDLTKAPLKLAS